MNLMGFQACICMMNDVKQGLRVDENCKDKSQRGLAECGGSRHDNISGFNFPRDLPGNVLQVKGRAAASLVLDCPSRFQRTSVTALEWMLEDLNCVHPDF